MRIGIIIASIVVIGGGTWALLSRQPVASPNTNSATNDANMNGAASTARTQSVQGLVASGDAVQCTFVINDPNGDQSWMMYSANGRVRGDYEVAATNGADWSGHIIRDDEYSYQWGQYQGQASAIKIKTSVVTNANYNSNANVASLDYDRSIEMNCSPWTVDAAKFTPPSDVTFSDLSTTVESNPELTGAAKAAACEACNQSTDASQIETCRQALGC